MSTVLSHSSSNSQTERPHGREGGRIFPHFSELRVYPNASKAVDWVFLRNSGSLFFSQHQIDELLSYQAWAEQRAERVSVQVLASERVGVFSLGGDLALFLRCIRGGNQDELYRYAVHCIDAVYANVRPRNAASRVTISLVQGEAQGGGVEAALSSAG